MTPSPNRNDRKAIGSSKMNRLGDGVKNHTQENILFLKTVEKRLKLSDVLSPEAEAEELVRHFGRVTREDFFTGEKKIGGAAGNRIERALGTRLKGVPLAQIIKERTFFGRRFLINPEVLIPRPETEVLLEEALKILNTYYKRHPCARQNEGGSVQDLWRKSGDQPDRHSEATKLPKNLKNGILRSPRRPQDDVLIPASAGMTANAPEILDIGTGSGCIAVSLTCERPDCRMTALEFSEKALEAARKNIRLHGLQKRIKLLKSDLFSVFFKKPRLWDVIVSNPPYIPEEDISGLPREVRKEPRLALDGGPGGTRIIHSILKDAPLFLKKGGWLLMEIGAGQSTHLKKMILAAGKFKNLSFKKDLTGIDRVLRVQKE